MRSATVDAMSVRTVLARPVPAAAATTVLLLPVLAATVLLWTRGADTTPVDFSWFGPGGEAVLTGRWGDVFGRPEVQAGPFELIPYGAARMLGVSGALPWTVLLTAFAAATAFLTALVLRPTLSADLRSSVLAAGGTAVVSVAGGTETWLLGHPSEALVPLLWAAAGRLALRDRTAAAAVLVAASTGLELWGVLGAPVVLLAARPRLLRAAAAGALTLAVLWAPFALTGPFGMFSFSWPVSDRSLLHALQPAATSFPWTFRAAQALLSVGAGTAVALLLRRSAGSWGPWAVVVAVVAGRLVLDPVLATYYWVPASIGAVGALVLAAHRADLLAGASAAVALVLTTDLGAPVVRASALVALCAGLAVLARGRARRGPVRRVVLHEGRILLVVPRTPPLPEGSVTARMEA